MEKFIEEIILQYNKVDLENFSNVILILLESNIYYIYIRNDPMVADAELIKIIDSIFTKLDLGNF